MAQTAPPHGGRGAASAQALAIAARTAFYKEVGPARRLLAAPPGAQVAAASNAWRLDLVGCR